jgi:hypothetical protein
MGSDSQDLPNSLRRSFVVNSNRACVDMNTKNETDRTELEKKIKHRSSARLTSDDLTQKRIAMLVSEIELELQTQKQA